MNWQKRYEYRDFVYSYGEAMDWSPELKERVLNAMSEVEDDNKRT